MALATLWVLAASLATAAPSFALYRHEYLPNLFIDRDMARCSGCTAEQIAIDNDAASPAYGKLYFANSYPNESDEGVYRMELSEEKYRFDCVIVGPAQPRYSGQCGSASGMPSPDIIQPRAVAVDEATGNVYIGNGNKVDEFSPAGDFIAEFNGEHTPAGSFSPIRLAVSESGKVYVLDSAHDVIDVFTSASTAAYDCQITGAGSATTSPSECDSSAPGVPGGELGAAYGAIALDESGATPYLYTTNAGGAVVYKFTAAGKYVSQLTGPEAGGGLSGTGEFERPTGLAADQSNGELYVYDAGANRIDEFSSSGAYKGQTTPVKAQEGNQLAVNQSTGDVYLSGYFLECEESAFCRFEYGTGKVEAWGPGIPVPAVKTGAAGEVAQSSATLNGVVDPEGTEVTSCFFEYGTTTGYGHTAPCEPSPGAGSAPVAVHAHAKLLSGTAYHYRVVASYAAPGSEAQGEDQTLSTLPPKVEAWTQAVGSATATVEAQIDPQGVEIEACSVEYKAAAEPSYGHSAGCVPDPTGAVSEASVGAELSGLAPHTSYSYRVAVKNGFGTVTGEELTFATFPITGAFSLPDQRAWERVSPAAKHGAIFYPIQAPHLGGIVQAAASGNGLAYLASAPLAGGVEGSTVFDTQILSTRGSAGWSSRQISTPTQEIVTLHEGHLHEYRSFSADLSRSLVESLSKTPLSPYTEQWTPYLRRGPLCEPEPASCYDPLLTSKEGYADILPGVETLAPESPTGLAVELAGATPDLEHVALGSRVQLTSTSASEGGLYEWSAADPPEQRLRLASILPGGASAPCGAHLGGAEDNGKRDRVRNAISADGSRVIWGNNLGSACGYHPYLYLRDATAGETLQIGAEGAGFQIADASDSRVFYTQEGALSVCEVQANEASGALECATSVLPGSSGIQGEVIGASQDGSYVYFVANDVLTVDRFDTGEGSWSSTPIATLGEEDSPDWGQSAGAGGLALSNLAARVSPNGRWLAFMSARPLTGYDSRDAASGARDEEVFLYDAAANEGAGALLCASCDPTGARPPGGAAGELLDQNAEVWGGRSLAALIPGWTGVDEVATYQSRSLTDSGRLFFDAHSALSPNDTNGTWDVYEWEPPAEEEGAPERDSCTESSPSYSVRSGGCVSLISSGASNRASAFLDASESGNDVFFLTASPLVGADHDSAYDVYDARVGGGFPEGELPTSCEGGESCHGEGTNAPAASTPGSSTVHSHGNLKLGCSVFVQRTQRLARAARVLRHRARLLRRRGRRLSHRGARRLALRYLGRSHHLAKAAQRRAKLAQRLARRTKRCRRTERRAVR